MSAAERLVRLWTEALPCGLCRRQTLKASECSPAVRCYNSHSHVPRHSQRAAGVWLALLPIVNPLGMAPIFAEMTLGYPEAVRRTVAMRVAINGIALLVASLFIGGYILQFLQSMRVQVGGGLLVTLSGWRILNKSGDLKDKQLDSAPSSTEIYSLAFYPLTMPLTVGPGSIAVALTLGSNLHEETHLQLMVSALVARARHCGHRPDDFSVLLVLRRAATASRSHGHEHPDTPVGVHRDMHRHPDRLQRAGDSTTYSRRRGERPCAGQVRIESKESVCQSKD